jgi:ATP-dependent Clp protease ATP-binding subunit ClpA
VFRSALQTALASARQRGADAIEQRDILVAILENHESAARLLAREVALDVRRFMATTSRGDIGLSSDQPMELPYSRRARQLLEGAGIEARLLGDRAVNTLHILLAGAVAGHLDEWLPLGTTPPSLRAVVRKLEGRLLER